MRAVCKGMLKTPDMIFCCQAYWRLAKARLAMGAPDQALDQLMGAMSECRMERDGRSEFILECLNVVSSMDDAGELSESELHVVPYKYVTTLSMLSTFIQFSYISTEVRSYYECDVYPDVSWQ